MMVLIRLTELLKLYYRVKAYIENGWDSRIIDPDPQKLYTKQKHLQLKEEVVDDGAHEPANIIDDAWPKGPYTQQVEGVLPPILLTESFFHIYRNLESN